MMAAGRQVIDLLRRQVLHLQVRRRRGGRGGGAGCAAGRRLPGSVCRPSGAVWSSWACHGSVCLNQARPSRRVAAVNVRTQEAIQVLQTKRGPRDESPVSSRSPPVSAPRPAPRAGPGMRCPGGAGLTRPRSLPSTLPASLLPSLLRFIFPSIVPFVLPSLLPSIFASLLASLLLFPPLRGRLRSCYMSVSLTRASSPVPAEACLACGC